MCLFAEFGEGHTLVMKFDLDGGDNMPTALNVAITKQKSFVKWEGCAKLALN